MNDQELDRMMSAASPVSDAQIAALDLYAAESELLEDIVATDTKRGPQRRFVAAFTAVAAVSLIIAGVVTSMGQRTEFAPAAVRVAEANPRVLVDRAGWKVTRADEFEVHQGEMTFGDGTHSFDLHWYAADGYNDAVAKSKHEGPSKNITVLGRKAVMLHYAGTTDYTALVAPSGENYILVRGDLGAEGPYRSLLADLKEVDVDTWLRAMPTSVVKPADRSAAVDEMLKDMPKPPGFDAAALRSGDTVKDRYQLGAQVVGAVSCGWLDSWDDAKRAGDHAKTEHAVAAMQTSHHWRVLQQMNAAGDYPEVVWEYADAMRGGKIGSGKGLVPLTDREQYASALGCSAR